jgi:hypothetical protein
MFNSDLTQQSKTLDAALAGLPEELRDKVLQQQIDGAMAVFRQQAQSMGLEHIDSVEKGEAVVAFLEQHPEYDPRLSESYFSAMLALDSDGTFREMDEETARVAALEAEEKRKAETPSRADLNRQRLGVIRIEGNRTILKRENAEIDDQFDAYTEHQRLLREAHGVLPEGLTREHMARLKAACIRSRREHAGERSQAAIDRGDRDYTN